MKLKQGTFRGRDGTAARLFGRSHFPRAAAALARMTVRERRIHGLEWTTHSTSSPNIFRCIRSRHSSSSCAFWKISFTGTALTMSNNLAHLHLRVPRQRAAVMRAHNLSRLGDASQSGSLPMYSSQACLYALDDYREALDTTCSGASFRCCSSSLRHHGCTASA